ncbi:MAG: glycosyltransferase [Parachlamydiaceae bacterium]
MAIEILEKYEAAIGSEKINELRQIAHLLSGKKILHINSTKQGGGVAEILEMMVQLTNALGIKTDWEIIQGTSDFFRCTKFFHNGLQGTRDVVVDTNLLKVYEDVNIENAKRLASRIEEADIVFIHDPQPAALIQSFPKRKNKWIWRCHIDLSSPHRQIWKYLRHFVKQFDASIFSLKDFAQPLPHPVYLIPPSIDPLSEKNRDLSRKEIDQVYNRFNLDPKRPLALQVSRFDYFKDPLGVIKSFQLAKKFKHDLQLILAGGGAPDDPEGEIVLEAVQKEAAKDPDIHILFLPADSHLTINALQRAATFIMQKSVREGFGLTVTEALWKSKPVIGGNTGGIRLQVVNNYNGFLVNTPEGAALRMRFLLQNPHLINEMGVNGYRFVYNNFLITRHLRDYLSVIIALLNPHDGRIDLSIMGNS